MKTLKDLKAKLIEKEAGSYYNYKIGDYFYNIAEFNYNRGWCINTYKNGELIDSYGYNGLTLRECKEMLLMEWNSNEIK